MGTFFASVCTVAVVAGILTAAATTHVARTPSSADVVEPVVNRVAKADRWSLPKAGTIRIRTISIPAASDREQAVLSPELTACDPLVSPLADPVASRRARQCAT